MMKTVELNAEKIQDRETLHKVLAEGFHFPDWYGSNLDAAYDLLTDMDKPFLIIVTGAPLFYKNLGNYFRKFMGMLCDVTMANHQLTLVVL